MKDQNAKLEVQLHSVFLLVFWVHFQADIAALKASGGGSSAPPSPDVPALQEELKSLDDENRVRPIALFSPPLQSLLSILLSLLFSFDSPSHLYLADPIGRNRRTPSTTWWERGRSRSHFEPVTLFISLIDYQQRYIDALIEQIRSAGMIEVAEPAVLSSLELSLL